MKNNSLRGGGALFVVALMLASSAAQAKKPPPPPQFVVIRKLPPSSVVARVQAGCLQNGQSVVQVTETQVVCSKPMDDSMRSAFIRALATPTYSTNPIYYFRVSAIRVGENTTVAAEEYVQYQNAYGQLTNIPTRNRKALELISAGLTNMKATWEARLDAAGGDEVAAMAASDAALASTGGMVASTPAPPSPASAVSANQALSTSPSVPAAKRALAELQCFDGFRIVGESSGKTLFEAQCNRGGAQLIECRGMSCKALH